VLVKAVSTELLTKQQERLLGVYVRLIHYPFFTCLRHNRAAANTIVHSMSSSSEDSACTEQDEDVAGSCTVSNNPSVPSIADSKASNEDLVDTESRYVLFLRLVVLLVLFLAAVAVSILVHSITSNGEEDSFDANYNAAAEKVTGKQSVFCTANNS